jgi:enoyl-CoA hydratase/carnithine racemase
MDQTVETWREGRAGRIRLNRPKALNALDLEMVTRIKAAVEEFGAEPQVHFLLIDAPERGFCAGGDVRGVRTAALAGDDKAIDAFFTTEYAMNQALADCGKPIVSLIDGVCMGGGIGLTAYGSHRIATENAMFAMPETAIALFPDVGMSFFLPRLPGALGMYLGLTGARLTGADAVHGGFATHFVPQEKLGRLEAALLADGVAVVPAFAEPLPEFSLGPHRHVIDTAFAAPSVPELLTMLAADASPFAQSALAHLREHSPLAIHWSFEIIRRGASRDLTQALAAEFDLVGKVTRLAEFFEGVRAMLVDKDRQPKWSPESLEEVDPAVIGALFA